ncbi:MAG TPA: peptidase M4 [Thermoanaerobaculia bacterium]|nr:peptidase M4 [Thermoanaerobaculia bacterium]
MIKPTAKKRRTPARPRTAAGGAPAPSPPPPPSPPANTLDRPVSRPLKAYAFDPSQGRLLGNQMCVNVRYEDLDPGPVVRDYAPDAIAIVDYDGANKTWYTPVDLDDPRILIRSGLDPSESDPRFHQQMVYAVVTDTIQHFEAALGRRIHWRRQERVKDGPRGPLPGDIYTLNVYPHAMVSANAFYSPDAHGILFGYFRAERTNQGRNLPGQTVFTCLSHDIVVHETTHAIIDGIRPYFTEQTNQDVPAFHEAFADIVALFRHFTHKEALLETIQRTGGALYQHQLQVTAPAAAEGGKPQIVAEIGERNPLVELAQQFGEATGRGRGLREALGTPPGSHDIETITEPHLRGAILVAAVFDAYFSIYVRRTADLFRIYRAGGGSDRPTDLPSSLAGRLVDEASRTAEQFFRVCVRALDYCPPVDVTFGDFLRAVVTADFDLHPADEAGMRDAFMQTFRLRGIVAESASFFSEGAIAWERAEPGRYPAVPGLVFGDPNGLTDPEKRANGDALRAYAAKHAAALGFDPNLEVIVPSFHPVFRINSDGSLRTDMVVQMVQRRDVDFDDGGRKGTFPLRGGATLIVSRPTAEQAREQAAGTPVEASIRYVIGKHLHGREGERRAERQLRYAQRVGLLEGSDPHRFQVDFALLHGGL